MKRRISTIAMLIVLAVSATGTSRTDSLLRVLDRVIEQRPEIMVRREEDIAMKRRQCSLSMSDQEFFDRMGDLYASYSTFNLDSALMTGVRREALARRMHRPDYIVNARLNQAEALAYLGMFNEAMDIVESIDENDVPDYLRPYLFHINRTIYGHLAGYSAYAPLQESYLGLTDRYRDSLMTIGEEGSTSFVVNRADHLNYTGHPDEAIALLNNLLADSAIDDHTRAFTAWTLSMSYAALGDTAAMKEQLIISSIGDLRSATREYVSLRHLALQLFREGDLERAYKLLNIALEDAMASNARIRIVELSNDYPEINSIYISKVRSQRRSLSWLLALISVLTVGLVIILTRQVKQIKEVRRSHQAEAEANEALNKANAKLRSTIDELRRANAIITENSRLKETYIGKYMDQCLVYMDKLDKYRKTLVKLEASGDRNALRKAIKSRNFVEDELKSFYAAFDDTFLKLFPDFVEEFNHLIKPYEAVEPKQPERLNTELRIYALIRLGITDSDRIAKFLGYSVTTIYNYRTRTRNKARGERGEFDEAVRRIGFPEGITPAADDAEAPDGLNN